MRKIICSLILVLLSLQLIHAQDTLIKINGDTLIGKLEFAIDGIGSEYVTIKDNGNKTVVKLIEVRMIETAEGDIIKPVAFDGKYKFGKQLHFGYLSYYKVTGDGNPEMFTNDLLIKMDGSSLLFSGSLGFRKRVGRFLEDCYDVAQDIQRKKYKANDLLELTQAYNICVNKNGLMSEDAIDQRAAIDRAEQAKEKDASLTKSLEAKLSDFSTLLKYSDKVANKDDVTAMFNDVAGKLRRKENVPNYLKKSLMDALEKDPQLTQLLSEILESKD